MDMSGRQRAGPRGIHSDKHQCRGREYQSHNNERAHQGRIDVGHHPPLSEHPRQLGVSRVTRSMIRISGALDFRLDRRKRLGRVHVGQCGFAGDGNFDNRLGVIADQIACAEIAPD